MPNVAVLNVHLVPNLKSHETPDKAIVLQEITAITMIQHFLYVISIDQSILTTLLLGRSDDANSLAFIKANRISINILSTIRQNMLHWRAA
jgi:hypothetical protein